MGGYLHIVTGGCLLDVGGGVLLAQCYLRLTTGAWPPAHLGLLWELAGVSAPFGALGGVK